jgi:hypothetical protein
MVFVTNLSLDLVTSHPVRKTVSSGLLDMWLSSSLKTIGKPEDAKARQASGGNPDGSVFFGEERPCLEVALERQTALAVSVARRQMFMEATQEAPIGVDIRAKQFAALSAPIESIVRARY